MIEFGECNVIFWFLGTYLILMDGDIISAVDMLFPYIICCRYIKIQFLFIGFGHYINIQFHMGILGKPSQSPLKPFLKPNKNTLYSNYKSCKKPGVTI